MNLSQIRNKIITGILAFLLGIGALISCTTEGSNFEQINTRASAKSSHVNVYLFYGDGCPHCAKERTFLEGIADYYEDRVSVHEFEVYNNSENIDLFLAAADALNYDAAGVPFLVVGETPFVGYASNDTTGEEIVLEINNCLDNYCADPLSEIILGESDEVLGEAEKEEVENNDTSDMGDDESNTGGSSGESEENENNADQENTPKVELHVPIVGDIDLKSISLPLATTLIAFMDGFNPCAMWILIFLITMLINMEDKKKLYILGSIFIITSALVYFVFLAAWFNFFKFLGFVRWIKIVIGIVAIVSGILHVRSGLSSKGGCHAVSKEKRTSIMDRIKAITKEKQFPLAIAGMITLAISVNLIEVVCSAGLPSIYTSLLSTVELSTAKYYAYFILYTVIFMLDDLIVFFIAIKSFQVTGITSKYTKWSSLVGGAIIFVIGVLLILKPEVLMFG